MKQYRGHTIVTVNYQGLRAYYTSALGNRELAASIATLKRWIDQAIAVGEIREMS